MQSEKCRKGLYEHTNSCKKLVKDAKMPAVDKSYKERTIVGTEVMQSRKKKVNLRTQGNIEIVPSNNWMATRTITEMNAVPLQIRNTMEAAMLNGGIVLDDSYMDALKRHNNPF